MIPYFLKKILAGDINSLNLLVFIVFKNLCIMHGHVCVMCSLHMQQAGFHMQRLMETQESISGVNCY